MDQRNKYIVLVASQFISLNRIVTTVLRCDSYCQILASTQPSKDLRNLLLCMWDGNENNSDMDAMSYR